MDTRVISTGQCQLSLCKPANLVKRVGYLASALLFGLLISATASADTSDGDALIGQPWAEITELARGSEVNWFLWGGSDDINQYVTEYIGGILKNEFDIQLNRIGLNDTAEAVNIVSR